MAATSVIDRCIYHFGTGHPSQNVRSGIVFAPLFQTVPYFIASPTIHQRTDGELGHNGDLRKKRNLNDFPYIVTEKNRQSQPMPKRVSRLRGGQILEPEYSCALTENPAI